jgi:N-carbamoyl-L-amino-acid hydrolase
MIPATGLVGELPKEATPPPPDICLAERLFDELRQRTGTSQGITRTSYGLGEQIAHEIVRREARQIGMEISMDAGGNLYMRLRGQRPGPAVFVGSHLDSVPLGGNFDGAAGVLAGLAVASGFHAAEVVPPQDLVVMAIRAEESTWFNASYVGSRAAFGLLRPSELDDVRRAGDQVTLDAAIDAAGGNSRQLRDGAAYLDPAQIACFIEPHIEQGPVLLAKGQPVGIVTGIRGSFRHRMARCLGTYAHSGATPRANRQDAVLATARLITRLDDVWQGLLVSGQELTVTFGQTATVLGEAAFSKVAGRVDFSLDIRSQSDRTLDMMREELRQAVAQIEASHGVHFDLGPETTSEPALMDRRVIANLATLAEAQEVTPEIMPCGAGHDAAVFAKVGVPTGMIFIRNANGSHNPYEAMDISDFAVVARILSAFCLQDLAQIS